MKNLHTADTATTSFEEALHQAKMKRTQGRQSFDFAEFGRTTTKQTTASIFRGQVKYKKPRLLLKAVFFKQRYVVIDVHLARVRIYRDKNTFDQILKHKHKHEIELGTHQLKLCKEDDESLCIQITTVNGNKHFLAFDTAPLRMQAYSTLESAIKLSSL